MVCFCGDIIKSGKKFQFQNPIHQNYKHIKGLKEVLNQNNIIAIEEDKFISIIVFIGEAEFKTEKPENVFTGKDYVEYIKSFQNEVLKNSEIKVINNFIKRKSEEQGRKTNKAHVQRLKENH